MGVDFYPCSCCKEAYTSSGDYGSCYACGAGFCMECVDAQVLCKYTKQQLLHLNQLETNKVLKKQKEYDLKRAIIRRQIEHEEEPSTERLKEEEEEEEEEEGDDDAEYYCEDCAIGCSNIDLETPIWDKINDDQYRIEFACKKLGLSFTDFLSLMEREAFIEEIESEKLNKLT